MARKDEKMRADLEAVLERANRDSTFRKKLITNPEKVLKEQGISDEAGKKYRFAQGMIPERGCNDFTCFSSRCGPTCYVTICFSTFRTLL